MKNIEIGTILKIKNNGITGTVTNLTEDKVTLELEGGENREYSMAYIKSRWQVLQTEATEKINGMKGTETAEITEKNFIVWVNRKYLTMVTSTSNGGAEHKVMDNMVYVTNAQAFGFEEMNTETYKKAFETGKMISIEELQKKNDEAIKKHKINVNILLNKINDCTAEVQDLEIKLNAAKKNLKEAQEKAAEYAKNAKINLEYTENKEQVA